jgi:hypothetical protein
MILPVKSAIGTTKHAFFFGRKVRRYFAIAKTESVEKRAGMLQLLKESVEKCAGILQLTTKHSVCHMLLPLQAKHAPATHARTMCDPEHRFRF